MRSFSVRSTLLVVSVFGAASAQAETAYSNLGLADAFDTDASWTVSGASSPMGRQSFAQRFVSSASGRLGAIEFAGSYLEGSGALRAALFSDEAGRVGARLESWNVDLSSSSDSGSLIALTSLGGVALSAGKGYWVGLVAQDDSWLGWNLASPRTPGTVATDFDMASSLVGEDALGALRVTTQPVPEPASLAALALGALVATRRRKARF